MFPERFQNKTNGITPRRWLLLCNPGLSDVITEQIGDGWITNLDLLKGLSEKSEDISLMKEFDRVKQVLKISFSLSMSWVSPLNYLNS